MFDDPKHQALVKLFDNERLERVETDLTIVTLLSPEFRAETPPLVLKSTLNKGGGSRIELRFEDFEQIWTILGRLRRILPLYTPENLIFFARLRRATFFSILPLYTPKTKKNGRLRRPLLTKVTFVYP